MSKVVDARYYRRLLNLQQIDFALVELTLYLDTHPNDPDALSQFNQLSEERKEVAEIFESAYGPLLQYGHSSNPSPDKWEWSESPWPWQV